MNRDIEFRGYDTDSKCWRYGYYFCKEDVTLNALYNSKANKHHLILWNGFSVWGLPKPHYQSEVDGESVGQFTGLYDENKKKIYDGDIVKCNEKIYEIIFIGGVFRLCKNNQYSTSIHNCSYLEVIGNVYEHLELLESEE